jgi:hypothetical protein
MGFISEWLGGTLSSVIDSFGKAVDDITTSDEERLLLKAEILKIEMAHRSELLKNEQFYEQQITDRWNTDAEHTITRIIRPLVVMWSFILFTIVILFDGNIGSFSINQSYVPMVESVVTTVIVAYFGGRSIEKASKHLNRDNAV